MEHAAAAITFDPHAEEDRTSTGIPHDKMGMWVFLCSEVMFFTGLIGSYIVLRFGSTWPRPMDTLNIWLTAANTFILICSSVTMVKALEWIQRGERREVQALHVPDAPRRLDLPRRPGLRVPPPAPRRLQPSRLALRLDLLHDDGFPRLPRLLRRRLHRLVHRQAFLGKYTPEHHLGIETLGLYWHFVDLVWILLFAIVYLI